MIDTYKEIIWEVEAGGWQLCHYSWGQQGLHSITTSQPKAKHELQSTVVAFPHKQVKRPRLQSQD